jgi:HEAT repeat protein
VRGNILLGLGCLRLDDDRATFVEAARDRDPFVRACALAALAMRGDRDAVEKLRPGLQDRNILIRIASAWGCGAARDPKAIEVLDAAFDHRHGSVSRQRTLAGEALLYLAALAQ